MTLSEDRATGALWAVRFGADGAGRLLPDREQMECVNPQAGWSWMHFPLSDQRARRFLERFDELPEPVREMLSGAERRLQVVTLEGWVFGVLPDLERDFDGRAIDIGRLYFALNGRYAITTRRHALRAVDEVRRSIEIGATAKTPGDLFVMLVERFIDLTEARQQHLAAEIDAMEDRVLALRADASRQHIGPIRLELSRQHREFLALRGAFHRALIHRGQAQQPHLLTDRLPALSQQLEDFDRDAADFLERARLLHEEIGEQIDAAANRSLQALTVLSTLLLPPTLIVGAFGMNVPGIPWAHDANGFAWASGLCVVVVVIAYFGLKLFRVLR